jgi:hypothetical protein
VLSAASVAKPFRKLKNSSHSSVLYLATEALNSRAPGPIRSLGDLKNFRKCVKIFAQMDLGTTDSNQEKGRPACFGDEAKYVAYMETIAADAECAKCPSEDECGEFILLKCSRELVF